MTDHRQIIERYFNSFRERDREALRAVLTADFHKVSSFAEFIRFDGERIAEIEVYLGREVGEAGDGW